MSSILEGWYASPKLDDMFLFKLRGSMLDRSFDKFFEWDFPFMSGFECSFAICEGYVLSIALWINLRAFPSLPDYKSISALNFIQ